MAAALVRSCLDQEATSVRGKQVLLQAESLGLGGDGQFLLVAPTRCG